MKFLRYLFAISVALGVAVLAVSFITNNENVAAFTFAQMPPPTPAPTRTPGPPVRTTPEPIPTLAQPLTEEQALREALEIDSQVAIWRSKPWSIDTPRLEPGRVTTKLYSDRSYDGTSYGPDAENGPVWVVTINGEVRLLLPGEYDHRVIHDGVTYEISQKTGHWWGVHWGPPSSNQPFLPKMATPSYQLPSAGTPAALSSSSCTQNPSGLSFRVSQQPWKTSIPGLPGPTRSFYVEGTGFIPGEKVTVVIKARITAPGTIGSTAETVRTDSTFATSVAAAVSQPKMPFDLFVIHRRGVACVSIIAEQ